jgi:hypothetical protein
MLLIIGNWKVWHWVSSNAVVPNVAECLLMQLGTPHPSSFLWREVGSKGDKTKKGPGVQQQSGYGERSRQTML